MGICSSSDTSGKQGKEPSTNTPQEQPSNTDTTPTPTSNPASAPAHIENPEGITILDHSTAHLENNEDDGGALAKAVRYRAIRGILVMAY